MCIRKKCSTTILILAALIISFGLFVMDVYSYIDSIEIIPANPTVTDNIIINVYGSFPDGCWGYNYGTHSINNDQIAIALYTYDIWEPSIVCTLAIVPYSDEFNIGQLEGGEYSINVIEYRDSLRDPFPGFYFSEFTVFAIVDTDSDGIPDSEDNCPETPNPLQEDTFPPQGNGIGDVCDCEGNFDCDIDVDAEDVTTFLFTFGRNFYRNPCTNDNPCKGDFLCDGDIDAFDLTMFLEDFGRGKYSSPCPICDGSVWCVHE